MSSLFVSKSRAVCEIVVMSHPISNGELMMHHIPKWVLSSSVDSPRPTSSMSMSLNLPSVAYADR